MSRLHLTTTSSLSLLVLGLVACERREPPVPEVPEDVSGPKIGIPRAAPAPETSCPVPLSDEELANYTVTGCDVLLATSSIAHVRILDVKPIVSPVDWVNWPESEPRPDDAVCIAAGSSETPWLAPSLELSIEVLQSLYGEMPSPEVVIPSGAIQTIGWNPSVALDGDGALRWTVHEGIPSGGQLAPGLELVLFLHHVEHLDLWLMRSELFERVGDAVVRQTTAPGPAGTCQVLPDQAELEELLSREVFTDFVAGIEGCVAGLTDEKAAWIDALLAGTATWFEESARPRDLGAATCWLAPEHVATDDMP